MSFVTLFAGATATNGAPTAATAGVSLNELRNANQASVLVNNTSAGAGDSITIRLWGRSSEAGAVAVWYPIGDRSDGTADTTKGTLNGNNAIAVNGAATNSASHMEQIGGMRSFTDVYAQIVAITGTWTAALVTRDPGNKGLGGTN